MLIKLRTPADIGRVVRAARKTDRLRQEDMAGTLNVSEGFLMALEHGAPGARLDNVCRALEALGLELTVNVRPEIETKYKELESRTPRRKKQASPDAAMAEQRRRKAKP